MYTYSQINGGRDAGSMPSAALNVALQQGSDTWGDYSQGPYDWSDQPTAQERANAANYKITGWQTLFEGSNQGANAVSAIEGELAANTPVAISIPVRPGFDNVGSGIDTDTSGRSRGNHEVFVLGYDQNGVLIQNSWGTGWGNNGFGWLGWNVVETDVFEAEVIDGINFTEPNHTAFTQLNGSLTDVAVGANGTEWGLGTVPVPGGYQIFERTGNNWTLEPGGAVDIAVAPDGSAWVVNSIHQVSHWNGVAFGNPLPGTAATDISVGANGAIWVIGTVPVPGGYQIFERNGNSWTLEPGGAVDVAVAPDGSAWVVNSIGQVFQSS